MFAGRSYVRVTLNIAARGCGTRIICADGVHHSLFDIDDRDYVPPIASMLNAPVKLTAFLKKL